MMKVFHINLAGSVIVVMHPIEDGLFLYFTGNIRCLPFWDCSKTLMWTIFIIQLPYTIPVVTINYRQTQVCLKMNHCNDISKVTKL